MSDNMESTVQAGGDLGAPTQSSSPVVGNVQTSSVDAKSLAEALMSDKDFLDAVAGKVRSVHDKRTVEHEKRLVDVEGVLAHFQELKDEGWSDKQAIRLMKSEAGNQPTEPATLEQALPASAVGAAQKAANEINDLIIEDYARSKGYDPTSAEYVELVKTSIGKEDLLQKLYKGRTQGSTASAAAVLQTAQGAASPTATPEQYIKEIKAARGQGYDIGRQIKDKFRKAGVDVDNIVLS